MRSAFLRVAGLSLSLLIGLSVPAAAQGTSFSYTYDSWESSVEVPAPYTAEQPLDDAANFGGKALNNPTDLFVTDSDEVFLLDAGNNRLVVLDKSLGFDREIRLKKDGKDLEFAEALGLFVASDGTIYVADKKAPAVYVADSDGNVVGTVGAPPADQVEEGFEYTPSKVLVDSAGIIYVLSANTYSGALQYDTNYQFISFYGSERVEVSLELIVQRLWKKLLSEKAAAGIQRSVPTSFINFDIDAENFIYTIRGGTGLGSGQIRKLNPQGTNILFDENGAAATYGDLETYFDTQTNLTISTTFNDIVIDDEGYFTVLDGTRNRLFQYDQSSNLLYAFGGSGSRYGNFKSPIALDSLNGQLLVLDSGYGSVTRLTPTEFGKNVRNAIGLFNDGRYEDARESWEAILKQDAGYELANVGMGKVYEQLGDYATAMKYYKVGHSKTGYSEAFGQKRDDGIRSSFALLVVIVVVVLLGMVLLVHYKERHPKNEYAIHPRRWQYPLRCMAHPFKAYYELKVDKSGSMLLANGILALLAVTAIMQTQLTGFHFNQNRTDQFNLFLTLGSTLGLFLLFVLCNWAVSTLADGEGTLKEIWIFSAYAMLPLVITMFVTTLLSNVFSLEESAFLAIIQTVAYLWVLINLLMAVREVHQYTTGKCILLLLLTLLGMYLLILIVTLGYSMFTQLLSFITMILNELRLR